jgi:hypothetical protein
VSVAVGVLLGGIDESGFGGVLNDIVTMLEKALPIPYPRLGKTHVARPLLDIQIPFLDDRRIPLNQLHGLFHSNVGRKGH